MASWWNRREPRGVCRTGQRISVQSMGSSAYKEVQADVDEQEERDEGERSPQPVGAMSAVVVDGIWWVEVQGVVAGHFVERGGL